jgi:hypothetical protein
MYMQAYLGARTCSAGGPASMTAMLIACPLIVVLGHRFHHLSQATYVLGSVILVFSAFSFLDTWSKKFLLFSSGTSYKRWVETHSTYYTPSVSGAKLPLR